MKPSRVRFNYTLVKDWLRQEHRKQSYLAANLGVNPMTVSRMLSRDAPPDLSTVVNLAKLMGVEIPTLLLPALDDEKTT